MKPIHRKRGGGVGGTSYREARSFASRCKLQICNARAKREGVFLPKIWLSLKTLWYNKKVIIVSWKKIFGVSLVLLVAVGFLLFSLKTNAASEAVTSEPYDYNSQTSDSQKSSGAEIPTEGDLAALGFVSPRLQSPTQDGGYSIATYFWLNGERPVSPPAGGSKRGAKNLLMVSIVAAADRPATLWSYGASTTPLTISGGSGGKAELSDGRAVVNFLKNGFYAVVIGPDEKKIETLARVLADKL